MTTKDKTIKWLLESDPSIRWQVYSDLLDSDEKKINRERNKISLEGWGAKLLSLQDEEGTWAQSLYSRKWISTTYTLLLLQSFGLDHNNKQAGKACQLLLDNGFYSDNGINFASSWKRSETCVTGMILFLLCYFNIEDTRIKKLVKYLLNEQMKDGGWNCQSYKGATHSSFNTTIIVLEALHEYEKGLPFITKEIIKSQDRGREFLLLHKLFRSHKTNKIAGIHFTRFSFPPRWHYDILRALDYFRECKVSCDERMNDAFEIIFRKQNSDGTWNLQQRYPGKTWFEMETVGRPSRWNTLRILRILKFYNLNCK
jgi:hypothetical protein